MPEEIPAPRRRALLIGINEYVNLPERFQLDGCRNDVALMRSVLTSKFGFAPEDVRMLVDGEATRDAILAALDALVAETADDDIVVLHYAGHGSQMRDREDDEADDMDETIVPHDGGRPPAPNREITDDELHLRLTRMAERTRNITLIFDCCHSGTIVRDMTASKVRQLDADPRPPEELPPSPLSDEDRARLAGRTRGPSGWFPVGERYVLLSGCRDEERSYEHIAAGDEAVPHGALTWHLADALLRAVPGTTYRDVFEQVSAAVSGSNPAQHPQIEGTLEREVFGVRDIEPMRFVAVEAREPGSSAVTLAGGAAHGLTTNSRWNVVPQGAKRVAEDDLLGVIRITQVGATRATAAIEQERAVDAIVAGARAVEAAHDFGEMRLDVRMEGARETAPDAWDALVEGIGASGLLRANDAPGPRVRVIVLPPRTSVGADDPLPQVGALSAPALAVVSEAGELMMAPKSTADVARLVENLEQWARYRLKLTIRNDGSTLDGAVTLELLRREGDAWHAIAPDAAGGMRTVEVGDTIEIRLTNTSGEPLHVALFDFRPTGEVKRLFPAGRADPLQPGVAVMLGRGRGFTATWPKGFPFLPNPFVESPAAGTETLKVFVTTEETDFGYLEQASASRDLGGLPSPLQRLLAASHGGSTTRDLDPVPPDDWATAVLPFSLRSRAQAAVDPAKPLDIEGVSVRAEGAGATVQVVRNGPPAAPGSGGLRGALESQQLRPVRTLALGDDPAAPARAAGPALLEITTEAPHDGWGSLLLSVAGDGALGWHMPEETRPEHLAMRSAPSGRHTYRLPRAGGSAGGTRLELRAFPLLDPEFGSVDEGFAARWEERRRPYRVRTFTPEDYRAAGRPLDAEDWRALGAGRALLLLHGPFASTRLDFHDMTRATVEGLHRMYGGRVFAVDHPTLSQDPKQNAAWLLQQIPAGVRLDIDIVCRSRGRLVGRVLAERADGLTHGGGSLAVGRVLLIGPADPVAAPAGADPVGTLLDHSTRRFVASGVLPDDGVGDVLEAVMTAAKLAATGAHEGLAGLHAMWMDGAFARWLDGAPYAGSTRYIAIATAAPAPASDAGPSDGIGRTLLEQLDLTTN